MKILILVLSADFAPYDKMITTAKETWDSPQTMYWNDMKESAPLTEIIETIYYCGKSNKENADNVVYLPIREGLFNMGHKTILALEWALQNKEFDFIARVHSSIYVDKVALYEYCKTLPTQKVFAGAEATSQNGFQYIWGGVGFLISKDVVERIVANKDRWNHSYMEDEAMSLVVSICGVPFSSFNRACSIDKQADGWKCISYCGKSTDFTDFSVLKELGHAFYRVKNDADRNVDEYVMQELFKALKTNTYDFNISDKATAIS